MLGLGSVLIKGLPGCIQGDLIMACMSYGTMVQIRHGKLFSGWTYRMLYQDDFWPVLRSPNKIRVLG